MKYKILALFANHTCTKIKYNITLNNISLIKEFITNIIIIDSENEYYSGQLKKDLEGDDKISNFFYIKNDHFYDFGKWISALEKINIENYDYILFLNDSIILTSEISKYFYYIENTMNEKTNLYAYNDSSQLKYHYQSYLFIIKTTIRDKFIDFFENKRHLIHNLESLVKNVELNMCEIDENHDVFIKIGTDYNLEKNLYWENEDLYKYLLNKNIFAIIKLKKILDMQKQYKITLYGHSIDDFDYNFYKEYYDFNNMTDKEALDHFINYGQYEGRKHRKEFNVILPKYYVDKLDDNKLLYFFDVPDDFDIYYYKKNNPDIDHLSILDTIFHYINDGYYEGRIYNKQSDKSNYLNSYYLKILSKLDNINNISLPNNFNLYAAILLNNILDKHNYYGMLKLYINNNNLFYDIDNLIKILSKFDSNKYKRYHNLDKLDNLHLIQHYIANNKDIKIYKIPKDFNHKLYKELYIDLSNFNNDELEEHYMLYGMNENRIYKLPEDFNPTVYKEIYSDLIHLSDSELINHYMFKGINENRIYKLPNNFDINIYKKIYKNLANSTDSEIKEHYATKGKNNKIYKIPDDFSVKNYKKIYKDVRRLNNEDIINHYLSIGINEKRIYKIPDDFDPNLYKKIYPDLFQLNEIQLAEHYLSLGISEGRYYKIPDDFDPDIFRKLNKELNYLNNDNIKEYYLLHGIRENKKYKLPEDFNPDIYKKIYKDLSSLNNDELITHYIDYGINEKRLYKLPEDFDPNTYKKIYKDLSHLNDSELEEHYLFTGIFQNMTYILKDGIEINNILPNDFDAKNYKRIYKDISSLNDDEAKNHYLQQGIKENRIYKLPDDFNPTIYKKIYNDLNKLNDEEAKNHYLFNGISEKRIYKLPNDFSSKRYKEIYNDLSKLNDEEAKNHYLFNGINEKRKYK